MSLKKKEPDHETDCKVIAHRIAVKTAKNAVKTEAKKEIGTQIAKFSAKNLGKRKLLE